MSNYLRREADSFVFRRRAPPHLQYRLRRKELYRSLNTTVRKTAKVRAAELFIQTEGLFRMLEEDEEYVPTEEDIRAVVRWSLNTEIWQERIKQLQSRTPGSLREHPTSDSTARGCSRHSSRHCRGVGQSRLPGQASNLTALDRDQASLHMSAEMLPKSIPAWQGWPAGAAATCVDGAFELPRSGGASVLCACGTVKRGRSRSA